MPKRNADARDVFELMEACRFGGDFERLQSILDQCRFELSDTKSGMIALLAGRSPSVKGETTAACEKILKRRIDQAERRLRSKARPSNFEESG